MAIAEYMLHRNEQGHKVVPSFIIDGGHWWNPADFTMVGWIEDVRDYYVPDSLVILTREQFASRMLGMHAANPFVENPNPGLNLDPTNAVPLTDEQVVELANGWYDKFTLSHTGG
jgi:hypothetical protein